MSQRTKRIIGAALGAVLLAAIVVFGTFNDARATGGDHETPIIGSALDQASAAALKYVGQGKVTDSEIGDEEGYYEIEITRADGSQVDVHLDQNFTVLGQEADGPGADDEAADDN